MTALVAAVAAAAFVLLVTAGSQRRALARWKGSAVEAAVPDEVAVLLRLRPVLVVLAVVGGWTVLGGVVGVVVGAGAGVIGWRILGKVESPAAIRRRKELERDLPMAVHLLGAALSAGAAITSAVGDVAEAMPGAVADELRLTRHLLLLGADPGEVWSQVDGPLLPLGRSMARAHRSGASVVGAVQQLADELRAGARLRSEALARTVEVRASAPLGVCFLPAFVVLGVVPMVVGIFSSMSLFG